MSTQPSEESPVQFEMVKLPGDHGFTIPCTNRTGCMGDHDEEGKSLSPIRPGKPYFTDQLTQHSYCEVCGSRLRYHRKKAVASGDEMPVTFADVEKRFAGMTGGPNAQG